jgi:mRNA interferase MazF
VKRGDIVLVAGGVDATKARPALVVQDDRFDATESLTVCPFTSVQVDAPLLRLPIEPDDRNGLAEISHVMVDKLTTVRKVNLRDRIGSLDPAQMVEFDRRLLVFLGLAG